MKKATSSLAILICSITLVYSAGAHVRMIYPAGGESFFTGSDVTVEWIRDQEHNQLNWDLYFSSDGGSTWQPIRLDIPENQFTYLWRVPKNETATMSARIKVVQDNVGMNYEAQTFNFTIGSVATVIEGGNDLPERPEFLAGYPNPFSSEATFHFVIAHTGPVALEVFDVLGKKVAVLVDRELARGTYRVRWNAEGQPNGVYIYQIRAGDFVQSKRVLLIR